MTDKQVAEEDTASDEIIKVKDRMLEEILEVLNGGDNK